MLKVEKQLLERVDRLKEGTVRPVSAFTLAQIEAEYKKRDIERGEGLTSEQCEALRHLTGNQRIAALTGYAGTGKGFVLGAVREALERSGHTVIGLAVQGNTAQRLQEGDAKITSWTIDKAIHEWDKGGFKQQYTTALQDRAAYEISHFRKDNLLTKKELKYRDYQRKRAPLNLTPRTVVIIDEASQVDSVRYERILKEIEKSGAQIRMVGDALQLLPVAAGAPFQTIINTL